MLLYALSFMLGMTLLLPWNAFMKAIPYVQSRIPTEYAASAPQLLIFSYALTSCTTLVLLSVTDLDSRLLGRSGGTKRMQTRAVISARLYCGLAGLGLLLLAAGSVPLSDLLTGASPVAPHMGHMLLFWLLFVGAGCVVCLLQRAVYPFMALLPGRHRLVSAMLLGQGTAGISASLGSFALVQGARSAVVAVIYFALALVVLLATGILYYWGVGGEGLVTDGSGEAVAAAAELSDGEKVKGAADNPRHESVFQIARLVRPWPQLLMLNFALTLSVFPGLIVSVGHPCLPNAQLRRFFYPITCLTYDVFDLLGKGLPLLGVRLLVPGPTARFGRMLPLLRILLLPLILLLPNLHPVGTTPAPPVWDFVYFVALAGLALTHGWAGALCLINAPRSVPAHRASDRLGDRIGSLMGMCISFGLLLGCLCSIPFRMLLVG